jgi:hypothetical protein
LPEVVDASIGMGYGTILTPVLLMIGLWPSPSRSGGTSFTASRRIFSYSLIRVVNNPELCRFSVTREKGRLLRVVAMREIEFL